MKTITREKWGKRCKQANQKYPDKDAFSCVRKREIVLLSSIGTNFQQEVEEYYLRDLLYAVHNKTYNLSTLVYEQVLTMFENHQVISLYDYFTRKLIVELSSMDAMTKYCNMNNYTIVSQLI